MLHSETQQIHGPRRDHHPGLQKGRIPVQDPLPVPPQGRPRRRRTEPRQPDDKVFAVGFSFGWLCVHSVYKLSCTEAQERARDNGWRGGGSRGVREREEGRGDR